MMNQSLQSLDVNIYYRKSNLLIDLVDKGDSKILDDAMHEVDKARSYYVYLLLYY